MIYSSEKFIKAHTDVSVPYLNHSYDRRVRDAICGKCGHILGEQVKYSMDKNFSWVDRTLNDYAYCPYCGEPMSEPRNSEAILRDIRKIMDECASIYGDTPPTYEKEYIIEAGRELTKLFAELESV